MKVGEYVPGEDGKPGAWLLDSGVVPAKPAIDLSEYVRKVTINTDSISPALQVGDTLRFEAIPLPDEED